MLKESGFFKSNKIRVILVLEILLLLIGVVGLFGKTGVVVGTDNMDQLINEGVELPAGVYTLRMQYEAGEADPGDFGVAVEGAMYKSLLANTVSLYPGINQRECEFYLRDSVSNLKAVLEVAEDVEIQELELIATNKGSRIYLFWVICGSVLLDALLMLSMYHRKHPIAVDRQMAIFGIPMFALIASIPTFVDYNIIGADLIFHMQRIEALTQSILRGELSVRMESMWLGGHGYANSFFYGDTCLFIPAFLRILGMNMDSAYRTYLVIVNIATACISYVSFSKSFKNRYIGVLGCALYTLAPYRMYNMYNRAAVGEYTAMIFLPLLAWGFYRIYTEDANKKGYLWNWVIPVIGFSGVIQSHALSCEMTGIFVVILCLVLWKKTFKRRTFIVLALTVIMTIVINAWFLVPFLDLMSADKYYFGNNANVLIQNRGILLAQIFYTLQAGGSSSRFEENGMMDTEPIGLGAALLLALLLWVGLRIRHCKEELTEEQKQEKYAGDFGFAMTVLALYMSTCYFPWDFLSKSSKVLASLVGSLQFPTRMTTIVTIFGVFVACVAGKWILREKTEILSGKSMLILLILVSVIFGNYQVNNILVTRDQMIRLYTAQNVGTTAVLGAEYLPKGAVTGHMKFHEPILSDGVTMEAYAKDGLEVTAFLSAKQDAYVEFPLLYYKGYRAEATDTGETLTLLKGENCDVRLLLPEGFEGNVSVKYAGMWYWHLSEALSVITGGGMLLYYIITLVRKRNVACNLKKAKL